MGWETRGNGQYYYRKRREGRRVVSEYIPRRFTELWTVLDEGARAERDQQQLTVQNERKAIQAVNEAMAQIDELVPALVNLSLTSEGYHQHKGQWRRKRRHDRENTHRG